MSCLHTLYVYRFVIRDDSGEEHDIAFPQSWDSAERALEDLRQQHPQRTFTLSAEIDA